MLNPLPPPTLPWVDDHQTSGKPSTGRPKSAFSQYMLTLDAAVRSGSIPGPGGFVNVKQSGAVGDGVTDDAAAIQAAINNISSTFGGGYVYFPSGNPYLVNSTIIVPNSVTLLGGGVGNCSIMARNDITVLDVTGDYAQIINLTVLGKGTNNDTGTFGATQPAVQMDGVEARMSHARVEGGAPCIRVTKDDTYLEDVTAAFSYGIGIVTCDAVTWMNRCKLDQAWPVSLPSPGTSFAARANATPYALGAVVSVVQFAATWYIQCATAGTSGGADPTLKNYDQPIVDGTVVWKLVCRSDMDDLRLSANEFHGIMTDISAVGRFGVLINGAVQTFFDKFIIGQQWLGSISADSGRDLYVNHCELNNGINPNTRAVLFGGGWTGNAAITDNAIYGSLGMGASGIDIGGGVDTRIRGNKINNFTGGVIARAAATRFIIGENSIVGCTVYADIAAGCNNFNIVNNLVSTSGAINDASGAVTKTITGNV